MLMRRRADTLDLRQLIRETSEDGDDMSDGPVRPSPQTAAFSPFVLEIPDMYPGDLPPPHATGQEALFDDDVLQFGIPLPGSTASGPQLQQAEAPMQRPAPKLASKSKPRPRARKALKVSRHGISYSGLPVGITKSIASTFARMMGGKTSRLSKETVNAIVEAGEKFFEQLGGDLGAVSKHGGRKTIDESDVIAVLQRYVAHAFLCVQSQKTSLTPSSGKDKSRSEQRHSHWPRSICPERF